MHLSLCLIHHRKSFPPDRTVPKRWWKVKPTGRRILDRRLKPDYHRKSLHSSGGVLPTIQAQQDSWTEKPAFGTGLDEHLRGGRDRPAYRGLCHDASRDWHEGRDVEFNVSGMFAMPIPASNHNNHLDYDCSTIERKRPGSMVGPENDATRKDNNPKLRDSTPAPTPLLQRNGSGGGGQAAGQLGTGNTGAGSMGPSPHMMRRGTKKQAPAPPKPTNPPPSQPCNSVNHTSSSGSSQSLSPTPRPLSGHSPTSPTSPTSQPCATPRRHSSNQPPIQAPSHPPPEPPTQASPPAPLAQLSGDQQSADPSPPGTPTPPDTPPPSTANQDTVAPPSPSPYQSGSLPRPRPVPKPRNRPSIPPPPQPTTLNSDTNGICATAYKMMDPAMSFKGLSRALVPELAVDQQPATAPSSSSLPLPKDCDLDTESTVL
ncbi:rho GTPase-activating protein 17a isoform X4 [Lates japonicus]|uniref:Rho GTPase-activating protein 17a isoform X4 n=1 Tax=Lates japonicus TaxID=270547 RepID=A0AAD3RMY1_LATJO|nr:rho GTPase-activating protein 17a isoform X4 [Lates japonicus]